MFGASVSASQTTSSSSGNSSESANLRRLSVEDEEYVRELMRSFSAGTTADTATARQNAIQDVQGSIEQIFTQMRESSLPQIMSAQTKTGGYNSSTAQLMANDAFSRAVAQGAALTTDAISRYETTALNKAGIAMQGLQSSLSALLQAQQTSQTDSSFSTRSKSSTVSAGASFGLG